MAVTPESMLQAADSLHDGDAEVDWRNAAACAYYAAFHKCVPFVYGRPTATPGHGELIATLMDRRNPIPTRQAGYLLRQCKKLREHANYQIAQDFPHDDANTALKASRRIFDIVDSH